MKISSMKSTAHIKRHLNSHLNRFLERKIKYLVSTQNVIFNHVGKMYIKSVLRYKETRNIKYLFFYNQKN